VHVKWADDPVGERKTLSSAALASRDRLYRLWEMFTQSPMGSRRVFRVIPVPPSNNFPWGQSMVALRVRGDGRPRKGFLRISCKVTPVAEAAGVLLPERKSIKVLLLFLLL